MAGFTDGKGTFWRTDLTFGLVEDIQEKIELDLNLLINDPEKFGSLLLQTPKKLVELLWCICERQAMDEGISAKEFGYLFDRATLDKATNAIMESVISFYPRSSVGKAIREKLPRLLEKVDEKLEEETGKIIDKSLTEIYSKKVTNSPVSSV